MNPQLTEHDTRMIKLGRMISNYLYEKFNKKFWDAEWEQILEANDEIKKTHPELFKEPNNDQIL